MNQRRSWKNHFTPSRRSFLMGAGAGAIGLQATRTLWDSANRNASRPPWAVEHATDSFWLSDSGYYSDPPQNPLNLQEYSTDVLVVGGGYTGMSTAWHLLETLPGAKITLIDAAKCGFGASGRNGGWCMGQNLSAPKTAPELVDATQAMMSEGVNIVKSLTVDQGVDCDFTPATVIDLTQNPGGADGFEKTMDVCQRLGFEATRLDQDTVSQRFKTEIFTGGAEYHDGSASIQPGKLARGVRNLLLESTIEVFEGTKVIRVDFAGRPSVETDFGVIRADKIVLATNAYSRSYNQFSNKYIPIITNVVATEPLTVAQLKSIGFKRGELLGIEGKDDTYFYAIVSADSRIVIGGGHPLYYHGNKLHSGNHNGETSYLESYLFSQLWPQLEGVKISNRWGGNVCMTDDFVFALGQHRRSPDVYYSMGYSGEGVSTSFAAGKTLAQIIGGQETSLTKSMLVNRKLGSIPGEPFRSILLKFLF